MKKLYHELSGVKLLKPLINKIKSSYSAAPAASAPAAPSPDGVRRSSRIAAKAVK